MSAGNLQKDLSSRPRSGVVCLARAGRTEMEQEKVKDRQM